MYTICSKTLKSTQKSVASSTYNQHPLVMAVGSLFACLQFAH